MNISLNNASPVFDHLSELNSMTIGVAIIYFLIGLLGLIGNVLAAILIGTDIKMKNPTYFYMINLCLADIVSLTFIGPYSGLALLFPSLAVPQIMKISAYCLGVSWNVCTSFIFLMSFSRFIQLAFSHLMPIYFCRRNLWISATLVWIVPSILYSWVLYYEPMPFYFHTTDFAWRYNRNYLSGLISWSIFVTGNIIVVITITIFNIKSLLWVHQMRKRIRENSIDHNTRGEIKLFAQCAVTTSIFTLMLVTYYCVSILKNHMASYAFIIAHILWILNHAHNPIVYFALNSRLRYRLLKIFHPQSEYELTASTSNVN